MPPPPVASEADDGFMHVYVDPKATSAQPTDADTSSASTPSAPAKQAFFQRAAAPSATKGTAGNFVVCAPFVMALVRRGCGEPALVGVIRKTVTPEEDDKKFPPAREWKKKEEKPRSDTIPKVLIEEWDEYLERKEKADNNPVVKKARETAMGQVKNQLRKLTDPAVSTIFSALKVAFAPVPRAEEALTSATWTTQSAVNKGISNMLDGKDDDDDEDKEKEKAEREAAKGGAQIPLIDYDRDETFDIIKLPAKPGLVDKLKKESIKVAKMAIRNGCQVAVRRICDPIIDTCMPFLRAILLPVIEVVEKIKDIQWELRREKGLHELDPEDFRPSDYIEGGEEKDLERQAADLGWQAVLIMTWRYYWWIRWRVYDVIELVVDFLLDKAFEAIEGEIAAREAAKQKMITTARDKMRKKLLKSELTEEEKFEAAAAAGGSPHQEDHQKYL
jgi:hypothetical protein